MAFWSLASVHCQLEQVPGLEFLACGDSEAAGHQDNDCKTDTCAQVEDGLYKTGNSRIELATPTFLPLFTPVPLRETPPLRLVVARRFDRFASPELPVTWLFSHRAALPPRAPSFAS